MLNANPILRAIRSGRATPDEVEEALDELTVISLNNVNHRAGVAKAPVLVSLAETVEDAKQNLLIGDKINGLSTGYSSLDQMTKGMAKGELIVVFGDTSHGKSQLAQNISLNLALTGIPVMFIGLEMTNVENTVRFMTMLGRDAIHELPIIYPKSGDVTYQDIDGLVAAAMKEGVQLIVIDHLHMFTRDATNMANEISLITGEMKRVARKHEIPIMLISHINRGGTKKGVPELADLKGSGSIEQDCDIALAVWRDMNDETDKHLRVVLRKNRNRGRKCYKCELEIQDNARLVETVDFGTFPSTA